MTTYEENKIYDGIEDHLTGVKDPWYWTVKKDHVIGLGWRSDTNNGEGIVAYERRRADQWQYVGSFIVRDWEVYNELRDALEHRDSRFFRDPMDPSLEGASWQAIGEWLYRTLPTSARQLKAFVSQALMKPQPYAQDVTRVGVSFIHEGKPHTVYANDDEARDALLAKLSVAQNIHSEAMLHLRVKNLEAKLADKGTALERETAKQEALEKEAAAQREQIQRIHKEAEAELGVARKALEYATDDVFRLQNEADKWRDLALAAYGIVSHLSRLLKKGK